MDWQKWRKIFSGLSMKLALWTFMLVSLVTVGSSLVMLEMMEGTLVQELIRRGEAVVRSAATPAGFNILAGDRLALDNLAAKAAESHAELVYLAVVDRQGRILAHSRLENSEGEFQPLPGKLLHQENGLSVRQSSWEGQGVFEFRLPILFSGTQVGEIFLGLGDELLHDSRHEARVKIAGIAVFTLLLGVAGAVLLARIFTRPIMRLSAGVEALRSGECTTVPITSADELGRLTAEFNGMAAELMRQKESLAEYAGELERGYISTVRLLAAAIDARDEYTLGHSTRVANLAALVGRKLEFSEAALRDLTIACLLHDVGKIRIPDHILHKNGPLNTLERACIVKHPEHGADILSLAEALQHYVPAVLHHHERWDGKGYPAGLRGAEIPLFAAILAIADAYDAMTSSRPYRAGLPRNKAVAELRRCCGQQFSPRLVEVFIECLDDYQEENVPVLLSGVA